jgi:hypothetical protein
VDGHSHRHGTAAGDVGDRRPGWLRYQTPPTTEPGKPASRLSTAPTSWPGQGQPGHHLAARPGRRRQRQPAAPRGDCPGDRRRPTGRSQRVRRSR